MKKWIEDNMRWKQIKSIQEIAMYASLYDTKYLLLF